MFAQTETVKVDYCITTVIAAYAVAPTKWTVPHPTSWTVLFPLRSIYIGASYRVLAFQKEAKLQSHESKTPFFYLNWLASEEKKPTPNRVEIPLFSDTFVAGDSARDFGPYRFVNVMGSGNARGFMQPTLIVRFAYFFVARAYWSQTGHLRRETFQGGRLIDEIAALASLALGIRLRAGEVSRVFSEDGDPLGTPNASGSNREFLLLRGNEGLVLPAVCDSLIRRTFLEDLWPFEILPRLSSSDVTALLRAAYLYQDALWIGESDPTLAWVMLVSAVETAADHWRGRDVEPLEAIRDLEPDLYEILTDCGREDLVQNVAKKAAKRLRSSRKFVDFSMRHLPCPPSRRPKNDSEKHPWTFDSMKNTMKFVYGRRSKALHEGRPFPLPLCESPKSSGGSFQEVPIEEDLRSSYSDWREQDYPIMLQTYEYIVRKSLLKWWKSMDSRS